jgi:catechol 2,3-dioxygenase-like lactoylglutathione lyase family enzyme
MAVDLFAGIPVSDYERSLGWYERFLGTPPAFIPAPTEAVWEVAEHRYLYIDVRPDHAGHAMHLLFVGDFDERVKAIAAGGFEPAEQLIYDNGVRKTSYRDPDGNEISFGGPAFGSSDGA